MKPSESMRRLRLATAPHHGRVEALMAMGPPVTLSKYIRFLNVWWRFLSPLEPTLMRERLGTLDLRARAKLPWLQADLAALGCELPLLTLAPQLPVGASLAQRLGFLYVVEGATLGGQVLLRQVAAELPQAAHATSFIRSYGAEAGRMWKQVVATLEAAMACAPDTEEQIVQAACEAFAAFAACAEATCAN